MPRFSFHLRHLLALSLLITTAGVRPASADTLDTKNVGLDFSLPTVGSAEPPQLAALPSSPAEATIPTPRYEPLRIPPDAIAPPVQTQQINNPKVYGGPAGVVAISPSPMAQLPPPPKALPTSRILSPLPPPVVASQTHQPKPLGLSFDPNENGLPPTPPSENLSEGAIAAKPINLEAPNLGHIFEGGSDSLVARIVGSAEGTRTADGERTPAYYGHVDPGNGVWNLGTFSYQHGANSPEDADTKQLARLQNQGQTLDRKATQNGLELSLIEKLNGLDLANQAPQAALDRGGYIERLAEARQQGMDGADAVLWARTHAYIDPDTNHWNAPGLGNNVHSISRDQERRLQAINRALAGYAKANITEDQTLEFDRPTLDIFNTATAQLDTPEANPAPTPTNTAGGSLLDSSNQSIPDQTEPTRVPARREPRVMLDDASDDSLFSAPGLDTGLSFALNNQAKPIKQAEPQTRVWLPSQPPANRDTRPTFHTPDFPEPLEPTTIKSETLESVSNLEVPAAKPLSVTDQEPLTPEHTPPLGLNIPATPESQS